ncbi:HU family DNA-binding protein [bacterium]|nr:MAG: HU family DNA-binding protein [bacterium]QQR61911.1 MAG: HU family DNA-binding protein [bacterium]QQR62502.1 MAG: HU family DNA-binding protein [bacterium]
MNKSELINELSEETTFSKRDVLRVVDAFIGAIRRSLKKGEKVSITGFGSFSVTVRPPRIGINPATKKRIDLPASRVARFKAGKDLRKAMLLKTA